MDTHTDNNIFDGRLLCSIEQAASVLGLSRRTVNAYIAAKHIVTRKIGRRRLVSVASLRAFASKDQPSLAPWSGARIAQ